jgi:multiple sugar transport system substrate-binding protein
VTPSRRQTLALLAAAPLAGCAGRTGDGRTIEFWAMGREGEVVAALTPEFERQNPGLKVRVQQQPWTAAHEKLLTAYAGGSLPDVGQVGNTWLPEFVALNAVEPLDARLAATPSIDKADYFPGIWSTNVVGNRLYGVPWYVDTRLLFYRRDLLAQAGFDHPPATWAEWMAAMTAIKRRSPNDYAALLPLNEYEPLLALAQQLDQPLLRDDATRGNFRNPEFKRALAFYDEIFRRKLAPVASNTDISNLYDEFDRGYFSFYVTGPWNIGEFKRRLPADRQSIWMTAPLPGPNGLGAGIAGGASLVVFESSPNKDAAWKLIAFLSRPAVQQRFHDLTGDLPPRRSAWAGALSDDVYARAFRTQLERVKPTPPAPEWERIATEMRLVAEQMVGGKLTVDQAAVEMDRRADRLLAKRRWMLERARARAAA